MIEFGVWIIGLKNHKSETELIIIDLIWFNLENKSIT